MKANVRHGYHWPGRVFRALVVLAVAALLIETWCIEGLFVSLEVDGGSMAPTLVGSHREVTCRDCGYQFDCNADAEPARERRRPAACPNCGYSKNDLSGLPVIGGDRVLVSRSLYCVRPPRRWELAAFRLPERPRQACVKRVVGLPGESIRIRDGEIYVDGQLARKPLSRQRALAVPVYRTDFTPKLSSDLPPRWQSQRPGAWGSTEGRFAHAWIKNAQSIDWLTYHHWRRVPGSEDKVIEGPITNACGYNQDRPLHPANVHAVRDVMLSFRLVRALGGGKLLVRATDGNEDFVVRIDPAAGRYELLRDGTAVDSGGGLPPGQEDLQLEVSLVDRQFILAAAGSEIVCYPFEPSAAGAEPTSMPFAIGSQGLGVEIRDLAVYRDVYYTRPLGVQGRWGLDEPAVLGIGEYYVLGDSSPISSDSRTWPGGPAVPESLLLGKPFLVSYPSWGLELGTWHFQVPDPTEIRYIR
jgi:signal peptidase I